MERRIAWVHGIGRHTAGYSDSWRVQFDRYLQQPPDAYVEVIWDNVFHPEDPPTRGLPPTREAETAAGAISLSPQEKLAAEAVQTEILTILGARKSAIEEAQAAGPAVRSGLPGTGTAVEWSDLYLDPTADASGVAGDRTRGFLSWLVDPREYLGDFAGYLVSPAIRRAVREQFKRVLRPLAGEPIGISVISHSWGTVVAYDSLLDLSAEVPALQVANLFTLGSPLWLVRALLEDRSGRKPANVANFVNVHALGDPVGSWLRPAFQVDKDYQVPSMGPDAHGSYFVDGNVAVQENIVAADVLR